MTEQEALDQYNDVRNEYERFCRENPEAVAYLEDLLTRYRQAVESLEALSRRSGQPLGPIRMGRVREVTVPEAVQKLAENQPEVFEGLGGSTETKYVLPVERVRQGIRQGLIGPETGSALIRKQPSFVVPSMANLPERTRT